ncbi:NmrA family NAD(P)-binding protein [Mesorhizobium sp. SB112]|uniref:NmrA family NAD(P)-binding protein n=1 Tax=Mesorhizobium sp. SB112 TaxID=3151853 RepID=UPI0032663C7A
MASVGAIADACSGADCVVSALAGLRDVIIGTQTTLLNAAIRAGVPRFIPSDFCTDFADLPEDENRNIDLRREFHEIVDAAAISATSIRIGAFAEVLSYNIPILNYKDGTVGHWGDPDHLIDFTTMNDTAAFTAAAAVDPTTRAVLRIASFQVSPADLVAFTGKVLGSPFGLGRMGSLEDLQAKNKTDRA